MDEGGGGMCLVEEGGKRWGGRERESPKLRGVCVCGGGVC